MNDDERDEVLYRIDERTERIEDHIDRIERRVRMNEQAIDRLESQTQKNQSDIKIGKAILGAVGTAITGVVAKISGLIPF